MFSVIVAIFLALLSVGALKRGYIQAVDFDELGRIRQAYDIVVQLERIAAGEVAVTHRLTLFLILRAILLSMFRGLRLKGQTTG